MKDYYAILGVHKQASEVEIKRAFRRLAVQFHPDKNPDPSAEQQFKEINEAYEVLSDSTAKALYDARMSDPFAGSIPMQPRPPAHRDPAYRKRRPNYKVKTERERMFELMAAYLPLANKVVYITFALCLVLVVDFILPPRELIATIIEADSEKAFNGRNTEAWWLIKTNRGEEVRIPYQYANHFEAGSAVYIVNSLILHVPFRVASATKQIGITKSIYGTFSFAPLSLLATSCFGILHRKRIDYGFNAGVISFMLLILTGVIYTMIHL
ncbi:DnaJ domain-containing protein [Chryseosolibacter indicus]|uniref:DnaJ domain-containing protein n=1 Tax=Chryseosolibacter indicus TaxID=2782351 RepID=A0ABS5VVW2_9BACT|nr:DnaJ domain-containing protein [Chryseosolibacter indicus]